MTLGAPGNGTVAGEPRLRVPVTFETESMEARFYAHFQIGPAAAMALNTGIQTAIVDKIMMAGSARYLDVFAMGKIQRQHVAAVRDRFAKRGAHPRNRQGYGSDRREDEHRQHPCRMAPKHQSPAQSRGLGCRFTSRPSPRQD